MFSKIPVWVFFVFAVLVFFGLRQARTRQVAPSVLSGLALGMFGLSLYGVIAAFGTQVAPLAAWALGMATSVLFGRGLVGPRGLVRVSPSRVEVPGSWLPLALMMGIFSAKFALGMATGLGLPVVRETWFVLAASGVFGLLSGTFTARALVVRSFMHAGGVAPAGPEATTLSRA
jgi:hypothetical protein